MALEAGLSALLGSLKKGIQIRAAEKFRRIECDFPAYKRLLNNHYFLITLDRAELVVA
ncbi:hypothetical protein [Methylobacterium sp. J-070]|uniref:hypothetical protein n=1 Tax=Methylobacterium sp. J-070 TaxID=2836650 RepID=UPI001FBA24CB|nr:hypothetical protein [Methylobacterium sp. J-070]MCJ2051366.1 hypothetical protein [Methylobacterium sp. J-070]